jgi:hypothetical protein
MQRTKSFSSYVNSLNSDVNNLKSINDVTSLSAGAITGNSFSEDITLFGSSIKSSDYVGGEAGWKIDSSGVAEFADVYVRGDINAQTGTIGYWNISSPGVIRRIGSGTQFGTFLESENVGPTDDSKTSGIYVGLFKSYFENPLPVTNIRRVSNVATITVIDSGFQPGDRATIAVVEDATYNNGGLPVTIISVTGDTISYINTGSDFPAAGALDTTSTAATGTVTFYNPDIAGLYIKDYGKADIDYGYFSSAGLAFVSGSRVNLVYNPSFEFVKSVDIIAIASTGGGANVTYITATTHGFYANKKVTVIGAETNGYNVTNATIQLSNSASSFTITSTATGPTSTATAYSKVPTDSSWNYVAATTAAIGLTEFSTLVNTYLTASQYGGVVSWSNTMSSAYRVEGVVAYNKGLTYNLFSNERVLALSYDSFVDYKPFTAVVTGITASTDVTVTVTTSGAHGLSVGDLVYWDFTGVGDSPLYGPGEILVNAGEYTVSEATSSTTFKILNPYGSAISGTITPVAINGRSTSIYHAINPAIPLDQISFKFPNGASTSVSNVASAVTAASWATANNKYIAQDVEEWMAQYLNPTGGIQPLKPVSTAPIYIDSEKLRLAYASLDAANFANAVSITLSIPAAIYQQIRNVSTYTTSNIAYMSSVVSATAISGNGTTVTVTAPNNFATGDLITITGASTAAYNTIINLPVANVSASSFTILSSLTGATSTCTATAYRPVRQIIDSVSLSTEPVAFYGDSSSDYAWEDPSLNTAAQISIQDPKKWIDVDLATQTGYLSNLDYINLKQSRLSEPMLVQPGIEADGDYSYDIGNHFLPDYNYENLKLSSGIISVYDAVNDKYRNYESRHNLAASKTKAVNQIIASYEDSSQTNFTNYTSSSSIVLEAGRGLTPSVTFDADSIFARSGATLYVDYIQSATKSGYGYIPEFPKGLRTGSSSYNWIDGVALAVNAPSSFNSNVGFTSTVGFSSTVRLASTAQYSLATTNHPFQIGPDNSDNLRLDRDGIQSVTNSAVGTLNMNTFGGTINAGSSTSTVTVNGYLRVESNNDLSLSSTTHPLQLGPTTSANLRLDINEVQAVNNGVAATLNMQASGGATIIGAGGGSVTIGNSTSSGSFILGSTSGTPLTDFFYKWGYSSAIGTSRALSIASTGLVGYATSTRDSKQDIQDLSIDVSSILSVVPKQFKYKVDIAQFGTAAETAYGFIAEDLDELGLSPFVDYDESGKPFGIDYPKYVVALQAVVKHQASQIQSLSSRLDALEGN